MMVSPNAFLSSPSDGARRRSHLSIRSSSPDLPPLQDVLSQNVANSSFRPVSQATALPTGKMAPIPNISSPSFKKPATNLKARASKEIEVLSDGDSSLSLQIVSEFPFGASNPVRRKVARNKAKSGPGHCEVDWSPSKEHPWKKFKSVEEEDGKDLGIGSQRAITEVPTALPTTVPGWAEGEDNTSTITAGLKVFDKSAKERLEPLNLEPAMVRRYDWTPPSHKTCIILDSDASEPRLDGSEDAAKSFEQLLETYKCKEDTPQEATGISDEESSFFRKRKHIELIPAAKSVVTTTKTTTCEKPPPKRKAPKKKPRTITEIATAAYRAVTPPEPFQTTAPEGHLSNNISRMEPNETKSDGQNKKVVNRKSTKGSRKKKKTPPPAKPILLPPSQALKHVANQNFVFGTSSQLAVEQSPTFLRDLQAAMKTSNELDHITYETPLNSDAIAPPEERPRLWDAGARDEEGDLFDAELSNITRGSVHNFLLPSQEDDPFGYVRGGEGSLSSLKELAAGNPAKQNLPLDLSDDGVKSPVEIIDDSLLFPDSEISTGSVVGRAVNLSVGAELEQTGSRSPVLQSVGEITACLANEQEQLPRPAYETYTDVQLSREIKRYGFKAVKARKAKIALLDQCWESKSRTVGTGVRTVTTLASKNAQVNSRTKTDSDTNSHSVAVVQKPRGRPRKNSVIAEEFQEPPPSAQPPASPKKPRGKSKKDPANPPKTRGPANKQTQKAQAETRPAPATPQRKAKISRIVVEIPDSESDDRIASSATPQSSPEPNFSPTPLIDLSLSINDGADLSLVGNVADEQPGSFEYITKAITSAPRTTDPSNPSWHEKILLYDPIVLEDLALWLNCGQLTRVGFDAEVSSGEVKKWCESKSICCLWKVNLRGQERKRY